MRLLKKEVMTIREGQSDQTIRNAITYHVWGEVARKMSCIIGDHMMECQDRLITGIKR